MTSNIITDAKELLFIQLNNTINDTPLYKENEKLIKQIITTFNAYSKQNIYCNSNTILGEHSKIIIKIYRLITLGFIYKDQPRHNYSKLYLLMCISNMSLLNDNICYDIATYNTIYKSYLKNNNLISLLLNNDNYYLMLRHVITFISHINLIQHMEHQNIQKNNISNMVKQLNIKEEDLLLETSLRLLFNIMTTNIPLYDEFNLHSYTIISQLMKYSILNPSSKQLCMDIVTGFFFHTLPYFHLAKFYLIICIHKQILYNIEKFNNIYTTYFNNNLLLLLLDSIVTFKSNIRILLCNLFDCIDELYSNNAIPPSVETLNTQTSNIEVEVKEQEDEQQQYRYNWYDFDDKFYELFNNDNQYQPVYSNLYIDKLMRAPFFFNNENIDDTIIYISSRDP